MTIKTDFAKQVEGKIPIVYGAIILSENEKRFIRYHAK